MKKLLHIFTLIIAACTAAYAQKADKFSQEIIIDCEDVIAAKMTSGETIYGNAKGIDITFPFKTRINPDKGAKIFFEVPGYNKYTLVVPPGGFESNFTVVFTVNEKEMAKLKGVSTASVASASSKNTNNKAGKSSSKKETMWITINCEQFKSAKVSEEANYNIGSLLLFGAFFAEAEQNKKTKNSARDVTFPYNVELETNKEHKLYFYVPGYNVFELVIPKGNTETDFKVHFTENPKEMAKLRAHEAKAAEKGKSSKKSEGSMGVSKVSRENPGQSALEQTIIRWMVDSDPQGARIFYRVISSTSEVHNTNESYLLTTPYEETRSFNILGLTYENSRDVQIEIKIMKPGYHTQVKRFNVRQAIDQQEISTYFMLVKKEEGTE